MAARLVVVAIAAASVVIDARLAVFWVVVAANVGLGATEAVPLSSYGMFASPVDTAWVIRVEDATGSLVPIGSVGVPPGSAHKRFSRVRAEAIAEGATADAAEQAAAADLADRIIERRRGHQLEHVTIDLVWTQWRREGTAIVEDRRRLLRVPGS